MSSGSDDSNSQSLERKRRRKLQADDPLRNPTRLLTVLDTSKDRLTAENDALADERSRLTELWQVQPIWATSSEINQLIMENMSLRFHLSIIMERAVQANSPSGLSSSDQPGDAGGDDGSRTSNDNGASAGELASVATHSETGPDVEISDEDIDAALGLFINASPEELLAGIDRTELQKKTGKRKRGQGAG